MAVQSVGDSGNCSNCCAKRPTNTAAEKKKLSSGDYTGPNEYWIAKGRLTECSVQLFET